MTATIAAISSAIGEAGIGIVRLSGEISIDIASKIFKSSKDSNFKIENRKLSYGHIMDEDEVIDEVLIAFMKAPYTYTRENMVEIYCHGGIIPVKKVLELTIRNGAELAQPGEYTKRAFLNGRLDLLQAEAVIDIINAKTEKAHELSLKQLEGNLSKEVKNISQILLRMLADITVAIDFPEEDIEEVTYEQLHDLADESIARIKKLLASSQRGRIIREGIKTVILGKPNVGKSSLLNAILRENRAIVTDIPGTTRDVLEEFINIDGIPLKLMDTAGIRETEDPVELIGVNRARESLKSADLVIAIFDTSRALTDEDEHILKLMEGKKAIILMNKSDLPRKLDYEFTNRFSDLIIIEASMTQGIGIEELEAAIKKMYFGGEVSVGDDLFITSIRHKSALEKALISLESAQEDIKKYVSLDLIEVDLKDSWNKLGEIIGTTISDDILDKIFREFCIGK